MPNYLIIYHGGDTPSSEEERRSVMQEWQNWVVGLGKSMVDSGNPVGKSYTIGSDGALTEGGGPNPVSGYQVVEATDLQDAHAKVKTNPHTKYGGTIELAEIHVIDMSS